MVIVLARRVAEWRSPCGYVENVDTTRIRSELSYREPIPHEEAIKRTIAWEREHPLPMIDPAWFDYEADDEATRRARAITRSA